MNSVDVELSGVRVEFADTVALAGADLYLEGGKIHGLIGRNGAGKSTLLAVIAAFRKPTAGKVLVGGEPVFENPDAMGRVCLVRETVDTLDTDEKVKATIGFSREMRPSWDDELAGALLEGFEIDTGRKIGALSRGKRAALGIVVGMAARAPLTMFDESYLGLDAPSRYLFYEQLLADFVEHPRTIVISTHLIEEVSSLFEDVVIIHEGRVLVHDEADRLRSMGVQVTGPADRVDRFIGSGGTVLAERTVGGTKSVSVMDDPGPEGRRTAHGEGIDITPIPLQDLFVHLTREHT